MRGRVRRQTGRSQPGEPLVAEKKLDPARARTYSLKSLYRNVGIAQLAQPFVAGGSFGAFLDSLPDVLAAHELRELARLAAEARLGGRLCLLMMGAHPIKVGLGPLICELMRDGVISALATNGAAMIHDFELALAGRTSEDVSAGLVDGSFGMASETGAFLNQAASLAAAENRGLGEVVGREIANAHFKFAADSIFACAYQAGIPATVHVTLGADIIHMHPAADGAAIGAATMADFHRLVEVVGQLSHGVVLNLGSAVVMPEVFLKALNLARNLGRKVENFAAADMDFIRNYRPRLNVVERPTQSGGRGFMLTGHHELLFPLLAGAIHEELARPKKRGSPRRARATRDIPAD